jgi:hypothetical protein
MTNTSQKEKDFQKARKIIFKKQKTKQPDIDTPRNDNAFVNDFRKTNPDWKGDK